MSVELLSIILGEKDLTRVNTMMATAHGSLRTLARKGATELNVTPRQWKIIQATAEFSRRFCSEAHEERPKIHSPKDVVTFCAPRMEDLQAEEFHVLILDAQHCLSRDVRVTTGIVNSSLVHAREVFREAIKEAASAIILVHNHPSGDPAPSADDRAVTEQLAAAGRVLDIPVHDHVIIGRGRYTSFAEAGLL